MFDGVVHLSVILIVIVPLLGAILSFLKESSAYVVAVASGCLTTILCGVLIFNVAGSGLLVHPLGSWGLPLGIELRVDGLSAILLCLVSVVMLPSTIYARRYFAHDDVKSRQFWPLWLFLWVALNALFVSEDAFNLYITLELMGLAAVGLTAMGEEKEALQAALRYLTVGLVGSLFYLLAVALIYAELGTLELPGMAERLAAAGPTATVALGLATVGLLMKTALFPLHFWLPPAHASAPAPVSAVLSALVVKASFYILLRFWFAADLTVPMAGAAWLFALLGGVAVLWGAAQALRQERLKLMVAYSTVAQIGYLFLLFPIAAEGRDAALVWSGTIYLVVSHGVAKAAMFLSVGTLAKITGHGRVIGLAGTASMSPLSVFAFAAAGVSLIGLPPSGGFIAKWLLLNGALANSQWAIVAVLLIGGLLASIYVFRVVKECLAPTSPGTNLFHPDPAMEWVAAGLATFALILGFLAPVLVPLIVKNQIGGVLGIGIGVS